jgi:hypothetical protein
MLFRRCLQERGCTTSLTRFEARVGLRKVTMLHCIAQWLASFIWYFIGLYSQTHSPTYVFMSTPINMDYACCHCNTPIYSRLDIHVMPIFQCAYYCSAVCAGLPIICNANQLQIGTACSPLFTLIYLDVINSMFLYGVVQARTHEMLDQSLQCIAIRNR